MTARFAHIALLVLALTLAACAPDNLDITPSPTPTSTPEPTATRPPTATPDPNADADATAEAVIVEVSAIDTILAAFPAQWQVGSGWRKTANETTGEEVTRREEDGGATVKVYYTQAGGSFSEITVGVFDMPEAAQAYYDLIAGRTRTLENAEERDIFPMPNLFGGGLYGQDALVLRGNTVVRVSVPRFNSNAGDPLNPLMRATLALIDTASGTA